MDIFFTAINSIDRFYATLITLFVVLSIISIPFFTARYKSRQHWAKIGRVESIDSDLRFRLFAIGQNIRQFERHKFFQNMYIVIALYIAVSGFFQIRNSMLLGEPIKYFDLVLTLISMAFPMSVYLLSIFTDRQTRTNYKSFKDGLNAKKLTIPVLTSTNPEKIEALDSGLFDPR